MHLVSNRIIFLKELMTVHEVFVEDEFSHSYIFYLLLGENNTCF